MTLGLSPHRRQIPLTAGAETVRHLSELNVKVVFGIPGVHNQSFYNALVDTPEIRSVVTRHEQGAAFMADGYARASGNVATCLLITGPGLTNAATAIAEAFSDSVPMVCIVTCYRSTPEQTGRRLHDLKDQALVIDGLFKESIKIQAAGEVAPAVRRAFQIAREGRPGPVALEMPIELLDLEVADGNANPAPVMGLAAGSGANAMQDRGNNAVFSASLPIGPRPVVVVGGGCVDASDQVIALVERLGAVAICTAAGKGVVPDDHHLALGPWLKSGTARTIIAQADPLILLGTEWSTTDLGDAPYDLPARIIRVDKDPVPHPHVGLSVQSDVATVIQAWLRGTEATTPARSWLDVPAHRLEARSEPRRWSGDAVQYVDALRGALSRDAIMVNDMNTLSYAAVERFDSYLARRFLFPRGFGTLGYALPAGIGAKLAAPDTEVVVIAGDGGFLFTGEELATAVRLGQNLPIIIWNNSSFGAIRATRTAAYGRSNSDDELVNPDFVSYARAFGAAGMRVSSPIELAQALGAAFREAGPTLIEVVAD